MGWYLEALLWPVLFCGLNRDGHVRGPTGVCHSLARNEEGGIFPNCISSSLSGLVSGCCFLGSVTTHLLACCHSAEAQDACVLTGTFMVGQCSLESCAQRP